jgi:hypothetical protein
MDAVQIEIKDEFPYQHQEFQNENQSADVSSTRNSNILNEELHIRNEHNDQGIILPSTYQENTLIKPETIKMKTDTIMDMFCKRCTLQFDKKYVFDLHLLLVHGEKIETISKTFNEPDNLDLTKSEVIKSEVKTEVKEEPFEKFEAREQGGIDFITCTDFDHSLNESEFPTQKTDFAIKHKIREEPNESNVPLKKFKQDCNQSNHYAKSETIEKKTDLKMASVKDNTSAILDLNKDFPKLPKKIVKLSIEDVPKTPFIGFVSNPEIPQMPKTPKGPKPFSCLICGAGVGVKYRMKKHVEMVHQVKYLPEKHLKENVQLKCRLCPALFEAELDFKKHLDTEHKTINEKIKFASRKDMYVHLSSVHRKPFNCEFCVYSTDYRQHLNKHVQSVHEEKKPFNCEFCVYSTATRQHINKHLQANHKGMKQQFHEKFKCEFCAYSFSMKLNLDKHVQSVHEEKKPKIRKKPRSTPKEWKCSACGETLSSIKNLQSHFSKVHETEMCYMYPGKKIEKQCNVCLLKFARTDSLKRHISQVHDVIKSVPDDDINKKRKKLRNERKCRIQCSLCLLKFTRKFTLNQHISKFHNGIKPVHDDYINEKRGNLKNVKRIQCDLCPTKFTRAGNLKQHISNVHEGLKPHQCSHCLAKFAFLGTLKRHLIAHKLNMITTQDDNSKKRLRDGFAISNLL